MNSKEYLKLLHLPTTSCILAFGIMGTMFAPVVYFDRFLLNLLQLFLIGGVSANYLDEIQGRPWHTRMPEKHLWIIATTSMLSAVLIGIHIMVTVSYWFGIFIVLWIFFTFTYDLELCNGYFHNTTCIALSWGSTCLGSYFIHNKTITPSILVFSIIAGSIAGQGRNLYERAKIYYKDKNSSASKKSRRAWTLLKTLIVFIDIYALIILAWRIGTHKVVLVF